MGPPAPSAAETASRSTPLWAITTSRLGAARPPPRPVEVALKAGTDALHQNPHRLAGDLDKALDAQDVVRLRRFAQAVDQRSGSLAAGIATTKVSKSS